MMNQSASTLLFIESAVLLTVAAASVVYEYASFSSKADEQQSRRMEDIQQKLEAVTVEKYDLVVQNHAMANELKQLVNAVKQKEQEMAEEIRDLKEKLAEKMEQEKEREIEAEHNEQTLESAIQERDRILQVLAVENHVQSPTNYDKEGFLVAFPKQKRKSRRRRVFAISRDRKIM